MMKMFRFFAVIAASLILLGLAACSSSTAEPNTPNLGGDPWILINMNGQPAVPDKEVTLQFGADGNLGGNAGCNSYFGQFQVDGSSLVIGEVGSTLMLCVEDPVMQQETRLLTLLPNVRSYTFEDGNLILLDLNGQALLEFRR